jgi:outer membrane protein TolC
LLNQHNLFAFNAKRNLRIIELHVRRGISDYFLNLAATFAVLAASLFPPFLVAQMPGSYPSAPSMQRESSSSGTAVVPNLSAPQNPFSGSVPEGKAIPTVLQLSFKDAINRGLRNNLGLLLQSDNALSARGRKWTELSNLLPNLTTSTSENVVQENLAALGIRSPAFPTIVGPFGYFDTRVFLSQSVFNWREWQREKGASRNQNAANFTVKDARDLVVLAVGNSYLQTLASAARVDTAVAQVQTAQALYDKSVTQLTAGVTPQIDSLRARVELQTRQQQLILARNDFAKQKLTLARTIGLPPGQEFLLSDTAPYQPLAALSLEESLQRAYSSRPDYQAAMEQVQAAEYFRSAASAERYPSLGINANYGDIGITPGQSHGTFTVAGSLNVPIFQGGKAHADVLQAEATLKQSRQQLENLRGQIDYDVRTALLDLNAAAEQVEVARSSVDLASQTLIQARDRFSAGVADNLEVVQAQQAVASANESYISSLYAHNLAKVELARAIGFAEEGVKQYLNSK